MIKDGSVQIILILNKESYSEDKRERLQQMAVKSVIERNIKQIDYVGLATDFCLKYTALDSLSEGFETRVIVNCIRGIDEKGCKIALEEMKSRGIELI